MRLNRFLAAAGFGSRRACEALIRDGKVSINGHFIRELATTVQPDDDVRVTGKPAKTAVLAYILLHKPKGYLCTRSDEKGRTTIFDLVPGHYGRLFHVGRLDKESEGLILLTNDGALSQRLTHPGHEVEKEYEVLLDKPFDPELKAKFLRGFMIEGGRAKVERIHVIAPKHVRVVLRQGIKRQIRLMFYAHGYEVKRLMRTRIGKVTLDRLKPGHWRLLQEREVAQLAGADKKKT
ncbi:MAG TPA: pseudouridine synthase [Terrimicrobiaceae bacterium]|nr:pseudouridine synthase [Terrimicrobiaceae bacterium]